MRNLIAPAALILSLAAGSAAFAATPAPAAAVKPAATAKMDASAKRTACEQSWKSQKTHTGTEAAFVAKAEGIAQPAGDKAAFVKACVAKG